jgi:hypothetical protein
MNVYPHNSALILNDSIFVENGGQTGSFTATQRSNAYRIAEQQATNYLGTFLLPTIVTGTWGQSPRIVTDYGYVHQVYAVNFLSKNNLQSCTLQSDAGCVFVWEDTYGYLDVSCLINYCNCAGLVIPYQVQVAYQAGLPTGVANQPAVLLALTMAAQISLNEMIFPSQNETTGDVGVEAFSSLDYSEKRTKLGRTAFGNSAKAQKIAQLLSSTIKLARPALLLR